jgi:hypothetical protein
MKATMRLVLFLLLASLSALATDLTITMTGTGRGHEGEQTHYWSSKFMRVNHTATKMDSLIDFEQGISYTIDHKKKVIQKISWDDLEVAMEGMAEQMKNMPAFAQKLMGGGDTPVTAEDLGSETILGRKCRKWKITMGSMILESSNDPTLKPPMPAGSFKRFLKLQHALGQMGKNAAGMLKLGEELAKVQGIALKTRNTLPIVGELTSVATLIKEGAIPAATFSLPEGYKTEDTGKKLRESMAKGR